MTSVKIACIGGDFVGPEVINEGIKILNCVNTLYNLNLEILEIDGGGSYYLKHGKEWPEGAFETCNDADAILLGAIGHPKARLPDNNIAGANIVLGLRFRLDLYANIRPTKLYKGVLHKISDKFSTVWEPSNIDFTIIRENTEGLYSSPFGKQHLEELDSIEARDVRIITKEKSDRVIRLAFQYAQEKKSGAPIDGNKRVTAIHKNNLLRGCQLFTREFYSIAQEYPKIIVNDILVDAFTQDVLRSPEKYSVCVTTNMFGDILTDLVSVLAGGMGMAPSGQINGWSSNSRGMFEPIHGSGPDIAGKQIANPIATILAVSMMLDWLSRKKGKNVFGQVAIEIEKAVQKLLIEGKYLPLVGKHKLKVIAYTDEGKRSIDQMDLYFFTLSYQFGRL